ncbi:MAG: class I SAM-dependent methyltransferase [Candidatus Helarchaeota archaeon]
MQKKLHLLKKAYEKDALLWKDYSNIQGYLKYSIKRRRMIILDWVYNISGYLLDFGCGNGFLLKLIEKTNINNKFLIGIDISKNRLIQTKRKTNNVQIIQALDSVLPFKTNVFDVVIASEILEHVPNIHIALKEINSVIKQKGILIVSVPNNLSIFQFIKKIFNKQIKIDWAHLRLLNYFILRKHINSLKENRFVLQNYRGICSEVTTFIVYSKIFNFKFKFINKIFILLENFFPINIFCVTCCFNFKKNGG